jgi:hypothetical protein
MSFYFKNNSSRKENYELIKNTHYSYLIQIIRILWIFFMLIAFTIYLIKHDANKKKYILL